MMNETVLIDWIQKQFKPDASVAVGIGDDAAVIRRVSIKKDWLLKSDMIIEDVHFDAKKSRPAQWGYKAMMCNVSDIAAMGGTPRYALIAVGMPRKASLQQGRAIMRGIRRAADFFDIRVVGGDTCRSDKIVISVMMIGEVLSGKAIQRSGAKVGDVLLVTGPLGDSYRSGHHLRFVPRLKESQFLTRNYRVHAMMDVSDGLAKDLRHLAKASKTGLKIFEQAVPLRRTAKNTTAAFVEGEDFELIFCMAPKETARLLRDRRLRQKKLSFYPIGRVVHRKHGLKVVGADGQTKPFPKIQDHHF